MERRRWSSHGIACDCHADHKPGMAANGGGDPCNTRRNSGSKQAGNGFTISVLGLALAGLKRCPEGCGAERMQSITTALGRRADRSRSRPISSGRRPVVALPSGRVRRARRQSAWPGMDARDAVAELATRVPRTAPCFWCFSGWSASAGEVPGCGGPRATKCDRLIPAVCLFVSSPV